MNSNKVLSFLKGLKWTTLAALALSGWLAAAWIKTSAVVPVTPTEIQRTLVVQPLPPTKHQQQAVIRGVPLQILVPKSQLGELGALPPATSTPTGQTGSDQDQTGQVVYPSGGFVTLDLGQDSTLRILNQEALEKLWPLNLGEFEIPAAKDERKYRAELDRQGKLTLKLLDSGGRFRLGGERYFFVDLTYSNLGHMGMVGLHQDLGRIGRFEWMAELAAGVEQERGDYALDTQGLRIQGTLRMAFPF